MMKKIYADISMLMTVNYLTGIQRVVRETLVRLLQRDTCSITLVVYNSENENFRVVSNEGFLAYFRDQDGLRSNIYQQNEVESQLPFSQLETGSVYLDMDNIWNCRLSRRMIYPILRKNGVKIVNVVYDILPITMPQFSHETTVMRFIEYLGTALQYSSHFIVNAKATMDELSALCKEIGCSLPPCSIAKLGCDMLQKTAGKDPAMVSPDPDAEVDEQTAKAMEKFQKLKAAVQSGPFLLMIGTVEPRKNHALVLDALDLGLPMHVIIAGKMGWNIKDLNERILHHPQYENGLFLFSGLSDAEIDYLYSNAYALVFPTFGEGYGLPLVEAFQHNLPVFASNIPILREVGGVYADYFDPHDPKALLTLTEKYLQDPNAYSAKKAAIAGYPFPTWDSFAQHVEEVLLEAAQPVGTVPKTNIRQMVVLTARHEDIMRSLPFVEKFMPFIEELVVCCPERNVKPFRDQYKGRLHLVFRTDDQLLNGRPLPEDHVARNFLLRCCAMRQDVLDDVFIMTDDDYRPMQPISQDVFLRDGRYQSYFFYDLRLWQGSYGHYFSFDLGAFATRDFLLEQGYPTYQYSSHQPQVIDKRIFLELLEMHPGIESNPYEEWDIYFNFGIYHHPDKFMPRPNVSMCWPGHLASWDLYQMPGTFLFENFYDELYEKGEIFEGFSREYFDGIEEENKQKAQLFRAAVEKQFRDRKVFESYRKFYFDQRHEAPSFVIYIDPKSQKLAIHAPAFIQFQTNAWTRVPVAIEDKVYETYPNLSLYISYYFTRRGGTPVLASPEKKIAWGDERLMLPVRSPKTRVAGGAMIFTASVHEAPPKTEEGALEDMPEIEPVDTATARMVCYLA